LILADVNVLLYAFRGDNKYHQECKSWLQDTLNQTAVFGVSPQVLASLIRITTHPKVFAGPDSLAEVFNFCQALLGAPNAQIIMPGEQHWAIFHSLCRDGELKGNLIQDAWWAALAIESGCTWITYDQDFARFKGLKWGSPAL
jgi:toxin-antitoxin system PIN domain toxin